MTRCTRCHGPIDEDHPHRISKEDPTVCEIDAEEDGN